MGSFLSCHCFNCRKQCCESGGNCDPVILTTEGEDQIEGKKYSWDTRPKINPEDYTFANINSQKIKYPGEINGQQFIIKNCSNAKIYLFDHASTITIDDCEDCLFVCGPVAGSVFLRDSSNSTLVCASSQLRLRDCKNIHLFVGCESDPIIESSVNIVTGPYYLRYNGIEEHFGAARLSNFKATCWASIYDFTPNETNPNWSRYAKTSQQVSRFVCKPDTSPEDTARHGMVMGLTSSFVPVTGFVPGNDTKSWRKVAVSFSMSNYPTVAFQFYSEMQTKLDSFSNIFLSHTTLESIANEDGKQAVLIYSGLNPEATILLCEDVKETVLRTMTDDIIREAARDSIRIVRKG